MSVDIVPIASLSIDEHRIRRVTADAEQWCLTDLWRAAGEPEAKRPANWLRKDGAAFVGFMQVSLDVPVGHIIRTERGRIGGSFGATWGHWQIALSYAQALSPAFHAKVNAIYKAHVEGRSQGRSDADRELARLALLMAPRAVESVWPPGMFVELARLWGIGWSGAGRLPRLLRLACGFVWRTVLGDAVYDELRKRNPHPANVSNHYHWLSEQRHAIASLEDFRVANIVARMCSSKREFEHRLRGAFGRGPIQLGMGL